MGANRASAKQAGTAGSHASSTTEVARDLERRSSAVTLSDMEVFIFPELMYSLVLANIMSPRIWRWRDDPWFEGLEKASPYRRITRLKQYIMDHYAFNLDLDTWGLTSKDREIDRFKEYVSPEALAQSNALFGYEGDKYYFDIDIRTHFGLDKYEGDVIPYWKTETVEAMDAFKFKPSYEFGAGECVSLAALYAAALFVVAEIPLSDIFLMATPLHSQNFIDLGTGILTNNRRLVTQNMWFNGSALSAQARRALENERVTVVAHESGYVHTLYPRATIDSQAYDRFSEKLRRFLQSPLDAEILGNFVRHMSKLQQCFQVRWKNFGVDRYIAMEKLLAYEYGCPYRFNDGTRERLMMEVAGEDFEANPLPGRIILDDLEEFVRERKIDVRTEEGYALLQDRVASTCPDATDAIDQLRRFCWTEPRLPLASAKTFSPDASPLSLRVGMSREDIIERLWSVRSSNELADLAFYAYRDLNRTPAAPFLKAALERSPVSLAGTAAWGIGRVIEHLNSLPNVSIYDGAGRLAQPDEVWNYARGDGVEKAVLLTNILHSRTPNSRLSIDVEPNRVTVITSDASYDFASDKHLERQTWIIPAPD